MQFGDRLKALRKERKMTQRDLAGCLNISDRVVGYYESNERFPKGAHTLTSIANVFNVSLDYLLGQELQDRFSYSEFIIHEDMNYEGICFENTDLSKSTYETLLRLKHTKI